MKKITCKDVAYVLGISVQSVRIGLQQEKFPFGWAIKTSKNRWTYCISEKLFNEYLGGKK